jgi:hypothetical protein
LCATRATPYGRLVPTRRPTLTAVVAVMLLLSGCAGAAEGPSTQAALLGCDELAPSGDLVAAALTDVAGVEPSPVPAMPPLEFDPFPMLLPAAGGLRCSWNAGTPAVDFTRDWGYLSVEALPNDGDAVAVRGRINPPDGGPLPPDYSGRLGTEIDRPKSAALSSAVRVASIIARRDDAPALTAKSDA